MTGSELTTKVLQGIRAHHLQLEDLARSNKDSNERLESMRQEQEQARRESNQRFEVIETVLRDVAEHRVGALARREVGHRGPRRHRTAPG